MTEAREIRDLVFADQMRALYDNLLLRNLANVLVAVFMAAGLLGAHPRGVVAAWFVGNLIVHALRVLSLHTIRERARGAPDEVRRLARGFSLWLVVVSAYWGGTAVLLVSPSHRDTQTAIAFCLGGMCAGGISANAYHMPVLITRLLLVMVPFSVRVLAIGDRYHVYLGLGMLLLMAYLVGYGREAWETSRRVFTLRNENLALVARLREEREEAVRSREAAESANAAKSRLFAAASHDLSQPLQALRLWAGVLAEGSRTTSTEEMGRHIASSVTALSELFEGVLELSRLDAGRLEVQSRDFAIAHLIDRVAMTFDGPSLDKDIVLRRHASKLWVHADPIVLYRMVSNLVSNAVRYTTRGRVVVGAKADGPCVRIVVADTGPGIPEDSMPQLFDEFYRVPGSTGRGFGLGLATVRRLADAAGYTLGVRSTRGRGTMFTITVPRAAPVLLALPEEAADAGQETSLRVLVVEDDDEAREALVATLRGWGIRHAAASTPGQAFDLVERADTAWDVVITDHDLGGEEDGLELLERLRRVSALPLRGIIVSGTMTTELEARAKATSCIPLRKPISPLRLRASLGVFAQAVPRGKSAPGID